MSRIGRMPISVPSGVTVDIDGATVTVKGPKGTLTHEVAAPITVAKAEDGSIEVTRPNDERMSRSLHGLSRTLISNMVVGVTEGYEKKLEIVGVGYRAAVKGDLIDLTLGFSHPVQYKLPAGVKAEVDKEGKLSVKSADKSLLGKVAADIRGFRPPEPYKGKGVRYQGEQITLKEGKARGKK